MLKRQINWLFLLKSIVWRIILTSTFWGHALVAATPPIYPNRPSLFDFIPQAFSDVPEFFHQIDARDHPYEYLQIGLLSAALVYYDQDILIGSQQRARQWNLISPEDSGTGSRLVARTKVSGINVDLRLPQGTNSYFYFIGDGLTTFGIMAGLAAYGLSKSDNRALHTASQVAESMVLTGIFVISSKYSFGRQSPNQRTQDGGRWRPMPHPIQYLKHISSYDAFPSGHVATATSTLMIVAANYIEKSWIMPVGYGALGLLMFGMLNNGVHWAADYPLGIAIGYNAAQTVLRRRQPQTSHQEAAAYRKKNEWSLAPFVQGQQLGLAFALEFAP